MLIKVVAQTIPTYTMSYFKIPLSLCRELEQLMCKFWWGSQENQRKIHWIDWEKMCWPKEAGGIGFRDLHTFNMAMLAKQGWKLLHHPDALVAKILKARYYPFWNFLNAHVGVNPSFTWRSILKGKALLL